MHHINLVLLDIVEGCEPIRQKAHFVRLYRRARHRCSLDPVAFSYVMKHSHLKEVTGLLHILARLLRLRAATCERIFLSYKPDRAYRPNVLTDRCEMIERNVADILQIMTGFDFSVLSSGTDLEIQLRRAQAAVLLEPFARESKGLGSLLGQLSEVIQGWSQDSNLAALNKSQRALAYNKRKIYWMLDRFIVAN